MAWDSRSINIAMYLALASVSAVQLHSLAVELMSIVYECNVLLLAVTCVGVMVNCVPHFRRLKLHEVPRAY